MENLFGGRDRRNCAIVVEVHRFEFSRNRDLAFAIGGRDNASRPDRICILFLVHQERGELTMAVDANGESMLPTRRRLRLLLPPRTCAGLNPRLAQAFALVV